MGSTYKDVVLADKPLAYYRLSEAQGATVVTDIAVAQEKTYSQITMAAANATAYNGAFDATYPPSRLFDGDTATANYTNLPASDVSNTGTPGGFVYDFGAATQLGKFFYLLYYGDTRTYYKPLLEVSDDGTTWTTAYSTASQAATSGGVWITFTTPVTCRYLRWSTVGSTANVGNHLVEFRTFSVVLGTATQRDGTYAGTPALGFTSPIKWDVDTAVALDGTDDHVVLPAGAWFQAHGFSTEAWVYPRAFNSYSRIFDFGNGGPSDNVLMALSETTTGKPTFHIFRGTAAQALVAPSALPLNQWSYLVWTYDGVTGRVYLNGNLWFSGALHQPVEINRSFCYIGRSNWSTDPYANMLVDECAIYDRALTPTEVKAHYDAGLSGTPTNVYVTDAGVISQVRGFGVAHPQSDYPMYDPTKFIAGTIYDTGGENQNPVEGATVYLVRSVDGVAVAIQPSGPNGFYSFPRSSEDPYTYYVVAFGMAGGTTPVHGTSNQYLTPS